MNNGKQEPGRGTSGVRVHICQMEVAQGNPALNTANMLDAIESANRDGAQLIVFPELAVCGSCVGSRWNSEAFLRECEDCGEQIREASRGSVVAFGNVAVDWARRNNDGSVRKYNALFIAEDGRFATPVNGPYSFVIKSCLPGNGSGADTGVFHDIASLAVEQACTVEHLISPVKARGLSLGCMLCGELPADSLSSTVAALCRHPVNLFVAACGSPFISDAHARAERVFASCVRPVSKPLVLVKSAGILDCGKIVRVFEGGSCAYDAAGGPAARLAYFRHDSVTLDIPLSGAAACRAPIEEESEKSAFVYRALSFGVGAFTKRLGISRVVIGASGGIDSAVVAAVCCQILGSRNVLLANMPGRFVSPGGRALARELAANLGCFHVELTIDASVELTAAQINGLAVSSLDGSLRERLALSEFMMENVQARDRSSRILAALASAFGGAFTCNSNKSEATVGYATLYGDLAGYLAPIADLWKGEVYEVGRHLNDSVFRREVIPRGCFERVPSAELSAQQNADAGGGDPLFYPYHDRLFESWVEWPDPATPEEILEWYQAGELEAKIGYNGVLKDLFPNVRPFVEDLERWWKQFQGMGVAKRMQAPPVLALKRRPLASLRGDPQMGGWFSGRYQELKKRVLG